MFVLYALAFADRANIGITLPYIKAEFELSNTQVGFIASLFAFAYAACQVPAAMVVRKWGIRRTVPVFMTLTSIVAAMTGLATSVFMLKASRLLLGVVEAPVAISMSTTINNWFPRKEKGTAAGIFIASTKFAPMIVPIVGAVIISTLGWRWVFFLFALPGIAVGIAWHFLVRDNPRESRFVSVSEADHIAETGSDGQEGDANASGIEVTDRFAVLDRLIRVRHVLPMDAPRAVLSSWSMWSVSASYLLVQAMVGVILFMLPLYLAEEKGFSIINVGFVASAPFAGAVLGNLLGGVISDRVFLGRRKPAMLITFTVTFFTMWSLVVAPDNPYLLSAQLFTLGVFLTLGYSAFSVYAAPMTTKRAFPVAISLINTMGQIGTALAPLVTGVLLDNYGWSLVFLCLSAASILALLLLSSAIEPVQRIDSKST
jgi:sugar phosphate permease